jgi:hypothetical protein
MTGTFEEATPSVRAGGQCVLGDNRLFELEDMHESHSLQEFF